MAKKNVLSDEEDDMEVEEHERKKPDVEAVNPEEDEETEDEFEKDGFIADDVDEDEQDVEEENRADSDNERQKKKKKKKRKSENNYVLDEEDYELILDKNTTRIRHPKAESKKFKRLKKAKADADEGQSGFSHAKLKCHLMWDNEGPPFEDFGEEYQSEEEEDDYFSEEDYEMVAFIINEEEVDENDEYSLEIDIPERIQISEEITGPPPTDEKSIEEESAWILHQLQTGMTHLFGKVGARTSEEEFDLAIVKDDIMRFLEFMHVQKLDVPFIAMYRKEECQSLLKDLEPEADKDSETNPDKKLMLRWHKILWAILELDRKWLLLQKRKSALQSYYTKKFEGQIENQKLFDSIIKSLKAVESEREIDDVDAKFNLHFRHVVVDERPNRKSQYSICSKAGLKEVAIKFSYSSEEFGLLISLEQKRNEELEDAKETPEEVASRFRCVRFENPQAVLRGARHMVAVEISCEPCVGKHVRSIFMDNAVVSTCPTFDGNKSIDSDHEFAGVKWLKDKPLTKFDDAQWLLIQKAEEEKLLKVSVKLPVSVHDKLISDAHDYYLSDGVSKSAQLWNEQRKLILKDAFDGLLLPSMAKEARALLTSRAKNWLVMEYGRLLWDKVSVGPYQKKDQDVNADDYEGAPRVMACCWGPGKPATTFVMLDSFGEVVDVLYLGAISLRTQNANDRQRRKNDQHRLAKFMADHKPHVIVVGAVNLSCTRLKEDINEIIWKMIEENPRDLGHDINVVYGDEALPHLYENSRTSSEQLQLHSGIVRRAMGLGRYLQNPLAMVATLCGPAKEILSWKLTPLESFLIPDEKYNMVEQIVVDATNQVGLDLNLAISHEWLFAPLQFISGLGPRKAVSLQRSLVRAGSIYTRKDLLNHGLDKKVFVNAVGFLRVHGNGFIDLLDDTRIHPESYGIAQELAEDFYYLDVEDNVDDVEGSTFLVPFVAIEHVRKNPNLLKALEVDAYARSKNRENKKETLDHIRWELIQGFQDWLRRYAEPNDEQVLSMILGETADALGEGKIVQATVGRVRRRKAECFLDSGLTGFLNKADYSDDQRVNDLTEWLNEGDIITAKIKYINKWNNKYWAALSCRESDLRSDGFQNYETMDPYYHENHDDSKKRFKSRMIVHPPFQNITADEAIGMLADKEPGESIIRPSLRGPSFLILTLKIQDNVYAHKDIIEGGKEDKDISSMLQLGKTLKIGEDVFEDLDEVMDGYVDPLVTHLKKMLAYQNFKDGEIEEVDESLRKEKLENPSRIAYSFSVCHEYPGLFILTYIRSSDPHHEYVALHPKGFKFRDKMFEDIDKLVIDLMVTCC